MNLDALREQLETLFPVRGELSSLELIENLEPCRELGWGAVLRLIGWESDGAGGRQIVDIKEQQVVLIPTAHADHPRLQPYLAGWVLALEEVVTRRREALTMYMPSDLAAPDVLELKRPRSADDYADAMLSSKQRLGGLLPGLKR